MNKIYVVTNAESGWDCIYILIYANSIKDAWDTFSKTEGLSIQELKDDFYILHEIEDHNIHYSESIKKEIPSFLLINILRLLSKEQIHDLMKTLIVKNDYVADTKKI